MPDLVLLDLVSPGTDGIKLMKDISERATCRLSSPPTCDRDELIAGPSIWGPWIMLEDRVVNYADRGASLAGRPVQLIAIEYRLLVEPSANAGRVLSYEHPLQRV